MKGDELEKVMVQFIEGEYNVLVATTIIESGLDIPNANTIIINNAHMFGLSDLHQDQHTKKLILNRQASRPYFSAH